jgi:hypothetical protein
MITSKTEHFLILTFLKNLNFENNDILFYLFFSRNHRLPFQNWYHIAINIFFTLCENHQNHYLGWLILFYYSARGDETVQCSKQTRCTILFHLVLITLLVRWGQIYGHQVGDIKHWGIEFEVRYFPPKKS